MHYTSLQLKQFRSYQDYSVELSPSVNIIVGPNASGKTNLLESVLVASSGGSYRARDIDLIMFEQEWAHLEAYTDTGQQRNVTIKRLSDSKVDKKITLDSRVLKRLSHDLTVPVTLFEPEHLRMVHGSPETRRDYLDTILGGTEPGYKTTLRKYKRALAQRNKLLKSGKPLADQLFVWDVQLSEYGALIHAARRNLVETINEQASQLYTSVSGKESSLVLEYQPSVFGDYASALLKGLQARRNDDVVRGFTTLGPHREDVVFMLNGHVGSQAASRGEARTIVLVCKLIELILNEKFHDKRPILLLDDVFSELDSARRRALTDYLKDYQTIITTTDADAILEHFVGDVAVVPLQG